MPRTTAATKALAVVLARHDVGLTPSQLQRSVDEGLGPLLGIPEPAVIAHYRALAPHLGSGHRNRSHDVAALAIAAAGHPCARLTPALLRLAGADDDYETPADMIARGEQRTEEAVSEPWAAPIVAAMRGRARAGTSAALVASPRDSTADRPLLVDGLLHGALGVATEAANGAPVSSVDVEDLATVAGLPAHPLANVLGAMAANGDGQPPTLAGARALVNADPETVAAVVQLVAASLPAVVRAGTPLPDGRRRWATLARSVVTLYPQLSPYARIAASVVVDVLGGSPAALDAAGEGT
ncbi:MAG: hypothetical protein ACYCSX_10765 [Acidimicrobiales bacterium]